ncbi:hypothetical protein AALO_G00019040 [Alosa alosa]|uniref:Protein Wnt n=1 Tax=Alosa alosa TaxID=278164 RepID=A0AAV6HIC3_9TELE|nr:hypothetical protein AALO_G00019040 [Alosa alosa]
MSEAARRGLARDSTCPRQLPPPPSASAIHLSVSLSSTRDDSNSSGPGRAADAEEWSLAVGHQYSSLGTQPILCGSIPGLVPKQLRFCRNYVEIMPSVAEGVKMGIQECQHQFRGRRWNCTTINDNLAIFGPVLDKGSQAVWQRRMCGGERMFE